MTRISLTLMAIFMFGTVSYRGITLVRLLDQPARLALLDQQARLDPRVLLVQQARLVLIQPFLGLLARLALPAQQDQLDQLDPRDLPVRHQLFLVQQALLAPRQLCLVQPVLLVQQVPLAPQALLVQALK
jgi:hypothetical protein